MFEKMYIGDGVYASFDGYHIVLTTQEGETIYLEADVFVNLIKYAEKVLKIKFTAQERDA